MRLRPGLSLLISLGFCLAACDDFKRHPQPAGASEQVKAAEPVVVSAPPPATATAAADPVVIEAPPFTASDDPQAKAIEVAAVSPPATPIIVVPKAKAPRARAQKAAAPTRDALIKAQVLLDRAHFSPGAIDGRDGSNFKRALAAYEQARGVTVGDGLDAAALQALTAADPGPITASYVITAEDVKGPFLPTLPTTMSALAELPHLGYATPAEGLAEKFHMDEALLRALNPGADFGKAGVTIVVLRSGLGNLPPVARIEVDKAANQVRAFDGAGKLVAVFPATVGSTERPAPSGQLEVKSVVPNPNYTYDPTRLTFGDASKGKLTIAPGPNNPVGSTWIDLNVQTFGIHGSPDPAMVGKVASHGCVRLTNWDAALLGRAVKKGVAVVFLGTETKRA